MLLELIYKLQLVRNKLAFRFFVIEPNDSVLINSIIESRDANFDENRFSSVPRPSKRSLVNETEDIGCSVVPEEVNEEDDLKIFDEAMKSQDVAFWKEEINNEMDFIMVKVDGTIEKFKARLVIQGFKQKLGIDYFDTYAPVARISTIRLLIAMTSIHNLIIHQMDVKTAFLNGDLDEEVYMNQPQGFIMPGNENKVDLTKEFLSSRFSMKDTGEIDVVSQLEYSRVIGCLMYAMTCTRPDIAFVVGKLSSPIDWYILVILQYWKASEKQTCITGSTTKSEFVALAAVGKEAERLKNLLLKIPLWSKPIAPIYIHYDSAVTLAKAYSQMYNGKSRHLGDRHNMIHEMITNGVISIEFMRSQQNLVDHLMKGLARDLVIKFVEGIGLKSN
ncbi:zinc finger, CCHC-type containing protein [Tanacetum coccineum]